MTRQVGVGAPARVRAVVMTSVVAAIVLAVVAPAWAHVELAASDPVDGIRLDAAPSAIRLEFSTASSPAGDGIVLHDDTGAVVSATLSIESETVVEMTPTSPLQTGQYLVSWTMQAGDAHPRTGTITFTVGAAPAISTAEDGGALPGTGPTHSASAGVGTGASNTPAVFAALAQEPSTGAADWIGRIARMVGITAVLLGLGAFIFGALVFEGSQREARMVGYWGRRAGAAVLLAIPLEIASQAMLLGGGSIWAAINPTRIVEAVGGQFGFAMLLRSLGGLGLFLGTRIITSNTASQPTTPSVAHSGDTRVHTMVAAQAAERFHLTASPAAIAGAVAVAASYLFDGHTAVTAPSWLVRFASVVHVSSGATWVGGVAIMAALFSDRRRRGAPTDAARLVVPFSSVAAASVVLVGLAGSVLAFTTVDSLGEFFSTPWGRALLAKLVLVGAAGAMGAYNHEVLVPRLKLHPDNPVINEQMSRAVRIEVWILLGVAAMTAILVGLAS